MFYGIQFEEEHLHQTHEIITLKSDISHIYGVIGSVVVRKVKKTYLTESHMLALFAC